MGNHNYNRLQRLLARHRKEGRCMHRDRNCKICTRKQVTGQDGGHMHYCARHAEDFARVHRPLVGLDRVWGEVRKAPATHTGPFHG